jgi:hypothetical protein
MEMASAIENVAKALRYLGTGNASSSMGTIEYHAAAVKESALIISSSLESIASAIDNLASAIRESDFHD